MCVSRLAVSLLLPENNQPTQETDSPFLAHTLSGIALLVAQDPSTVPWSRPISWAKSCSEEVSERDMRPYTPFYLCD